MSDSTRHITPGLHWTVPEAVAALPDVPEGALRFTTLWAAGAVSLELYAPQKLDPQQPHNSDEFYVIIDGTGYFVNGNERRTFAPGDVIFVPAFTPHRFEEFTENFKTWVIFIPHQPTV